MEHNKNFNWSTPQDDLVSPDFIRVFPSEKTGVGEELSQKTFMCRSRQEIVGDVEELRHTKIWQVCCIKTVTDSAGGERIYYLYPDGTKSYDYPCDDKALLSMNLIFKV